MDNFTQKAIEAYCRLHFEEQQLADRARKLEEDFVAHFDAGEDEEADIAEGECAAAEKACVKWEENNGDEYVRLYRYLESKGIDPGEVVKQYAPAPAEAGT